MTRKQGSKNNPKSVKDLISMLESAAEKEGVELTLEVKEKLIKAAGEIAEKTGNEATAASIAVREKFESLELELDETETDTYTCGSCHNTMGSEMSVCPSCEAKLTW